jgi:hypothetical protein
MDQPTKHTHARPPGTIWPICSAELQAGRTLASACTVRNVSWPAASLVRAHVLATFCFFSSFSFSSFSFSFAFLYLLVYLNGLLN